MPATHNLIYVKTTEEIISKGPMVLDVILTREGDDYINGLPNTRGEVIAQLQYNITAPLTNF